MPPQLPKVGKKKTPSTFGSGFESSERSAQGGVTKKKQDEATEFSQYVTAIAQGQLPALTPVYPLGVVPPR
jgi:hypothetical protein